MAPPIKSESDPGSISTGTVIKKESANERSAAVTKDPAAAKKDLAAVKKEPAAVKKGSATVIKSEPPTNGGPRASNQAVATSSKPKSQRENRFERRRMKRADDFTHQELRERYLIEQRARETFPGISIGEAVLKYIRGKPKPKAERKKCKAERKAERKAKRKAERERLATISEKPTGVSAGMAPIRQSNSWKHELVASQQQREEISRKLKDKYKDDLVEACFTTHSIEPDYTFIPTGNVYISRKAKEYTKEIGKKVYVVQKSSYQKLGIQVPTEVHKKALEHERLTRGDRDYINQQKDAREKREAKACLQGMFGKIPEEECETIVNRAFERSSGRVGRTQTICLPERLRRATIAHLRHSHTDYEKLLVKKALENISKKRRNQPRLQAERQKARKAVSLKIEEMWTKWEPAPPITKPWSSMENSTKEEYLKKIKGYGKKSRNESDSYNLDDGFVVDDDDVVHRTDSGDSDEDMGDWKEETPTNSDSYEPVSALKRKPSNRSSPPTNKKRRFETEAVSSSGSSFPEAHTTRIARSSARSISYKEISDSPYEPENAEDEHPRTTKGANTRMEEHTEGTRGLISGLISGLGAGFRRPALMDSKLKHEVIYISD